MRSEAGGACSGFERCKMCVFDCVSMMSSMTCGCVGVNIRVFCILVFTQFGSAASTTGQRPRHMLCDTGATQHRLLASAESGFFKPASYLT